MYRIGSTLSTFKTKSQKAWIQVPTRNGNLDPPKQHWVKSRSVSLLRPWKAILRTKNYGWPIFDVVMKCGSKWDVRRTRKV
jgi:hypothetical protein